MNYHQFCIIHAFVVYGMSRAHAHIGY